jgi:hypothetical protein
MLRYIIISKMDEVNNTEQEVSAVTVPKRTRNRKCKYTAEELKERHRVQALAYHYRTERIRAPYNRVVLSEEEKKIRKSEQNKRYHEKTKLRKALNNE